MTEAEWLTGADPTPMMRHLRGKVSERKLRLCMVASVRADRDRIDWPLTMDAVDTAERYTDGLAIVEELNVVRARAYRTANLTAAAAVAEDRLLAVLALTFSGQSLEQMRDMNSWIG